MARYDGSIRIDTKVNKKGFDKGMKSMSSTLKKMGTLVVAAFATAKIIEFGKASVKASSEMKSAMIGLRSIVDGQGRDFERAKTFIQDYIRDGLIPAKDATIAYKNLAARGYTETQIEITLARLKDAATFGRQASLSLGEAVRSATEGLKNENSILVDNAGVTRNVSKMWEDYAKTIGTTAKSLTQQQKIQAEVIGIMKETQFQVGDAAKVANQYEGQVAKLGFATNNFKIAIGNIITPIAQTLIPTLIELLNVMTSLANKIAQTVTLIFGKQVEMQDKVTKSSKQQKKAIQDLGKATKKTSDEAKKANASFDELNILSQESAKGVDEAADALAGTGGELVAGVPAIGEGVEVSPDIQKAVDRIGEILKQLSIFVRKYFLGPFESVNSKIAPKIDDFKRILASVWEDAKALENPLIDYFFNDFIPTLQVIIKSIGEVISGLVDSFNTVFKDLWDIIIYPFTQKLIKNGLPLIANYTQSLFILFTNIFGKIKQLFDGIWTNILVPVLRQIGNIFGDIFNIVEENWYAYGQPIFNEIAKLFEKLGDLLKTVWENVLEPTWNSFMYTVDWLWEKHLKPLLNNFLKLVNEFIHGALEIINKFIIPVTEKFTKLFGPNVAIVFQQTIEVIGTFLAVIIDVVNGVVTVLRGLIKFLVGAFTGDWEKAWDGIVMAFKGIFEGIKGIIKGVVNFVIDMINTMIRAITNGLNFLIEKMNQIHFEVPLWVPGIGGNKWGIQLDKITPTTIPKLAEGAVIPPNQEFLAVLGDQTSGTNIEAPLDTIKQALAEVLSQQDTDRPAVFVLDGRKVAKGMFPYMQNQTRNIGTKLVTGGAL